MATKRTILGPGLLTIDPAAPTKKEFATQTTGCTLVPKVSKSDPIAVLDGSEVPGERKESWTLKGKMLPDFGEADSLQEWLFTNRGKVMDFAFIPNSAKSKKLTGQLQIEAVEIGGSVAKADEVDFEFDVFKPQIAAYTPA